MVHVTEFEGKSFALLSMIIRYVSKNLLFIFRFCCKRNVFVFFWYLVFYRMIFEKNMVKCESQ